MIARQRIVVAFTAALSIWELAAPGGAASTVPVRPTGPEFTINNLTTGFQVSPGIAAIGPDELAVVWSGQRSNEDATAVIWGRRVGHLGPVAPEVTLSQVTVVGAGSIYPVVAGAPEQEWAVIWTDEDGYDGSYDGIFGLKLDTDLKSEGDAFQVNNIVTDYNQRYSAVTMGPDGKFFVAWHDQGHILDAPRSNIKGRLYDAEGVPSGDEFFVATTADGEPSSVRVAAFADGRYVATWNAIVADSDGYDILVRIYDGDGNGEAAARVNATVKGSQSHSDIATCQDGRFVVVWQSESLVGDPDLGVSAQWFDELSQKVGDEIRVNQYVEGLQNLPTVSTTPSCQAVVIWQSTDQDGDQEGVYGRILNPDGSVATDEFRVNTTTKGRQGFSVHRETAVVADSDGSFFAVWSSEPLPDDNWDIVGQGYCWLSDSPASVCGNTTCVGDPIGAESVASINAADALATLRAAVGLEGCSPCRCDVDSSGGITATDALRVLRAAVSLPVQLTCPKWSASQSRAEIGP